MSETPFEVALRIVNRVDPSRVLTYETRRLLRNAIAREIRARDLAYETPRPTLSIITRDGRACILTLDAYESRRAFSLALGMCELFTDVIAVVIRCDDVAWTGAVQS